MRTFAIALIIVVIAALGVAVQQPAAQMPAEQSMKIFASSADVQALLAKAKSDHKEGQGLVSEPLLVFAPYRASLEYRPSNAAATRHEHEAELMYVIEGSGALTTGGKLVDEKRTNAENFSGTAIEGGTTQSLEKGDFVVVPENTPHWFSKINGSLVLMTMRVPRTAGSPQ